MAGAQVARVPARARGQTARGGARAVQAIRCGRDRAVRAAGRDCSPPLRSCLVTSERYGRLVMRGSAQSTGFVRLVELAGGPAFYAQIRTATGERLQRRLGRAWTRRSRPP